MFVHQSWEINKFIFLHWSFTHLKYLSENSTDEEHKLYCITSLQAAFTNKTKKKYLYICLCLEKWNNSPKTQPKTPLIHACARAVGVPFCLALMLSLTQLRSAGAAVIQELFPRVSSIATLDISDNGTAAPKDTSLCDLDSFLSCGREVWAAC